MDNGLVRSLDDPKVSTVVRVPLRARDIDYAVGGSVADGKRPNDAIYPKKMNPIWRDGFLNLETYANKGVPMVQSPAQVKYLTSEFTRVSLLN